MPIRTLGGGSLWYHGFLKQLLWFPDVVVPWYPDVTMLSCVVVPWYPNVMILSYEVSRYPDVTLSNVVVPWYPDVVVPWYPNVMILSYVVVPWSEMA